MCKGLKMCQRVWVWVGVCGILPEFGGWGPWGVGVAFLKAVKETTDFEVFLVTALTPGATKFHPPLPSSSPKLPFRGIDGTPGPLAGASFLQAAALWPCPVGTGLHLLPSVWASHAAGGPGLDLSGLCLLSAPCRGRVK